MASQQINDPGMAKPVAWENLRTRLYKAVRASVMSRDTADDRRNLLEGWLSTLFREDSQNGLQGLVQIQRLADDSADFIEDLQFQFVQ